MLEKDEIYSDTLAWQVNTDIFHLWLNGRLEMLQPGLNAEPSIKVLIFLALLETSQPITYEKIKEIFRSKNIIKGQIPTNTLRTSVLNLGKTLDKYNHPLKLKSYRGSFELCNRTDNNLHEPNNSENERVVIITEPPAIRAYDIASILIERSTLPFHSLYFLEWSARWWETYSSKESELRRDYEAGAWEKLGIRHRLLKSDGKRVLGIIGLACGEGLAEIELLKLALRAEDAPIIHYLAIDSSPRLLRDHIGLLKETLMPEIEGGKLICGGIVADIFTGLHEAIERAKIEFRNKKIHMNNEFLPTDCGVLITYFGNCLGNNYQDQETEIFSTIHSIFQNRPLEVLVGVSVMRKKPDEYKINWNDFLLQTPRHLLEIKKFLKSSREENSKHLPEFTMTQADMLKIPPVIPEPYFARHQIEGQIYRFYYQLAFDLELCEKNNKSLKKTVLPKGTLILLYNIIKYNMISLVQGIQKCGLFNISYDENYHCIIETPNGTREYAVFSAFL